MVQPALSALLADLEALLGAPLFDRHARGMRLTNLGRELLPAARSLMAAADRAAEQAAALQSDADRVVRVGAIGGAVTGLLTAALPVVADRHPGLLVHVNEWDADQIDQRIAQADVDVALCRAPRVVPAGWRFEPLLADRFGIVAAASHPLAGRRLSLARLHRETWLALPTGSAARVAFEALFADFPQPPPLCQVSNRVPSLLWAMLKARPLLTLLPISVARQLLEAGELAELPLDRPLPLEPLGALVPAQDPPAGAETLLQVLRDTAGRQSPTPPVLRRRP
jgi:DNA-binding transcriptional LysR family regulator